VLERDRREGETLASAVAQRVRHPERVTIHYFDDGFVDALAGHLDATNELRARCAGRRLALAVHNRRGTLRRQSTIHTAG